MCVNTKTACFCFIPQLPPVERRSVTLSGSVSPLPWTGSKGCIYTTIDAFTADNNQVEFLAAGIPRDADDLEGWTAYENFMDELDSEQEVSVHVEAYLYGEGETFKATPEEVAYFKMRADADEEFLHDHCDNIEDADFTIQWSPDELYGVELEL